MHPQSFHITAGEFGSSLLRFLCHIWDLAVVRSYSDRDFTHDSLSPEHLPECKPHER